MRVLVIPGNGRIVRSLGYFHLDALRMLGVHAKMFLFTPQGFKGIKTPLRWTTEKRLGWELLRFKPDLLLAVQSEELKIPFLREIKKEFKITLAHYWGDDPNLLDRSTALSPYYDFFFTVDPDSVPIHQAAKAPHVSALHMGCDPRLHRTLILSEEEKSYYGSDVTFIGALTSQRADVLRRITHYDLKVWSPREVADYDGRVIVKTPLSEGDPLYKRVTGVGAWGEEMVKVYNASKVALNLRSQGVVSLNMRDFEVMGCGAFLLSEARGGLDQLFRKGEEFVSFETIEELPGMIDYYLSHEEERLAIARGGQWAVYQNHTYRHRMEELLHTIQEGKK